MCASRVPERCSAWPGSQSRFILLLTADDGIVIATLYNILVILYNLAINKRKRKGLIRKMPRVARMLG